MYTNEQIKELTTDLYYDLLEKYVALQAAMKQVKALNKRLVVENMIYNEFNTSNPHIIAETNNQRINKFIKIVRKHGGSIRDTVQEMESLKIKL